MLNKLDVILSLIVLTAIIAHLCVGTKKNNSFFVKLGLCIAWISAEFLRVIIIITKIQNGNTDFGSVILATLLILLGIYTLIVDIANYKGKTMRPSNDGIFELETCTFEKILTNQNQQDKYLFLKDLLEKEETSLTKEEKDAWLYFINDVYKKYDENTTAYAHLLLCDVVSERDNTMYNKFPQFVRDNYKFKEPYEERKKVADELYDFLYNTVGITDDMSMEEVNKKMEEYQKLSCTQVR